MAPLPHELAMMSLLAPYETDTKCDKNVIKCVLVGDGAVGKTSLLVSYTTNGYPTEYVPTAFDNYTVLVRVDNRPIRLQLCDTAGQDDFDSLRPLCYPGTAVFLVCFSVVSPTSFANVQEKWIHEIRRHCPDAPIVLVGTQCDLRSDVQVLIELSRFNEQPVSVESAQQVGRRSGCVTYVECSALTQQNLKEVFDAAIVAAIHALIPTNTAPPKVPSPSRFSSFLVRRAGRGVSSNPASTPSTTPPQSSSLFSTTNGWHFVHDDSDEDAASPGVVVGGRKRHHQHHRPWWRKFLGPCCVSNQTPRTKL